MNEKLKIKKQPKNRLKTVKEKRYEVGSGENGAAN